MVDIVEENSRGQLNSYIKGSGVDVETDVFRRAFCLSSENKMTEKQKDRFFEIIHRRFR